MDPQQPLDATPAQASKKRKFFKVAYSIVLHLLAAFAVVLIFVALAVQFKWTNTKGSIDINNRYFSKLAHQYGKDLKAKQQNFDQSGHTV